MSRVQLLAKSSRLALLTTCSGLAILAARPAVADPVISVFSDIALGGAANNSCGSPGPNTSCGTTAGTGRTSIDNFGLVNPPDTVGNTFASDSNGNTGFTHAYGDTSGNFGARASGTGVFSVQAQTTFSDTITNSGSTAISVPLQFSVIAGQVGTSTVANDITAADFKITLSVSIDGGVFSTLTTLDINRQWNGSGSPIDTQTATGVLDTFATTESPADGYTWDEQTFDLSLGDLNPGDFLTFDYVMDSTVSNSGSDNCGSGGYGAAFLDEDIFGPAGATPHRFGLASVVMLAPQHRSLITKAAIVGGGGGGGSTNCSNAIARSGDPLNPAIVTANNINGTQDPSLVPEPSTLAALVGGLGALAPLLGWRGRKRKLAA